MPRITEDMKEVAEKTKGWSLATATEDGIPNVACMGLGKILFENQLLLVDVFMHKTRINIENNPNVAVGIWDMESGKGYQFKGRAKFENTGLNFEEGVKMAKSVSSDLEPKSVLIVDVEKIYDLTPGSNAGKELE